VAEIRPLDHNDKELLNENGQEVVIKNEDKVRIVCPEGSEYCNDNLFLLYPQITAPGYKFIITLMLEPHHNSILEAMSFFIYASNPTYTTYLMALRYTLLALSVITFAIYTCYYIKSPVELRTFEHRYILMLSIALIFFNDPFYALTILKSNPFWAVLSTLFVTTFVSLLVFFWMIMVRRIHLEPSSVHTKLTNPFTIAIGIFFFVIITVPAILASIYSRFNPSLHFNAEYPIAYSIFIIFNLVLAILLLVMFFYNIYQVTKQWNMTIARHRFFLVFSFYFIMTLFFLVASGVYQSYEKEGVKLLFLFVTCNVYIFFMQFMWMFNRSNEFYRDVENDIKIASRNQQSDERRGMNYFDNNLAVNVSRSQNNTMNASFDQMRIAMDKETVAFGKSSQPFTNEYNIGKDGRVNMYPNPASLNSSQMTNQEMSEVQHEKPVMQIPIPASNKGMVLREVKSDGENEFEIHDEEEDIKNEYNQFDQEGEEVNDENQADFDLFQKYRDYDPSKNRNGL
jgi:hypothetical protein